MASGARSWSPSPPPSRRGSTPVRGSTPATASWWSPSRARTSTAGSSTSRAWPTGPGPRRWPGRPCGPRRPRHRPRRAVGARAGRRRGRRARRHRPRDGSRPCRTTRRATCWCSTRGRSCRCASSTGRDETGRLVVEVPAGAVRARRRRLSRCGVDVFTIFPTWSSDFAGQSLLGRASRNGLLDVRVHDLREHTTDVHRTVDDTPFGGGAGMVLRPEPVFAVGRGRRAAPAALPARARAAARFDQAHGPGAGGSRGLLAAVRPLRGGRRPGPHPPVRRRALDRRLRARRGRGGGHGGARGGRPARARGDGQRRRRPARSRSPTACSSTRSTPSRPASGTSTCPTVLRSGDHGAVARWRRAQALRRTLARPPGPDRGPGRAHRRGAGPARRRAGRCRRAGRVDGPERPPGGGALPFRPAPAYPAGSPRTGYRSHTATGGPDAPAPTPGLRR